MIPLISSDHTVIFFTGFISLLDEISPCGVPLRCVPHST